jgi:hypothetical protein
MDQILIWKMTVVMEIFANHKIGTATRLGVGKLNEHF